MESSLAILPIRTLGDPVLREPARDVDSFDSSLAKLADDMLETMYDAPGVGLAAPQVGVSLRLFVFDIGDGAGPGAIANPVLVEKAGEQLEEEGCLSIPALYWPRRRSMTARVDGFSLQGEPITNEGVGLMARMLQHETDHLAGRLFIDGLSDEDRRRAMAELRRVELDTPARGRRGGGR